MNTNTTAITRRILSTVAVGVLSIASAVPVAAEPDPGWPGGTGAGSAPATTKPDSAQRLRQTGRTPASTADSGSQIVTREVPVDDDALEYLQVGPGALAGMALTGAAAVRIRRAERHAPRPA